MNEIRNDDKLGVRVVVAMFAGGILLAAGWTIGHDNRTTTLKVPTQPTVYIVDPNVTVTTPSTTVPVIAEIDE